jgi:arylsulfatase A-like enzyme
MMPLLPVLAVAAAQAALQRHVLFVLIDDLGYADVGYHGEAVGSVIPTPAIDELALAGVRLEQYYVVQLCSPTRTSLLSGRYPYTIGMNKEVIVDGHPSCMPLSVATIADRLSAAGWATSAYGKWDGTSCVACPSSANGRPLIHCFCWQRA